MALQLLIMLAAIAGALLVVVIACTLYIAIISLLGRLLGRMSRSYPPSDT